MPADRPTNPASAGSAGVDAGVDTGIGAGIGWRALALSGLGISNALLLVWGSAPGHGAAQQLAAVLAGAGIGGAALGWIAVERRFAHMPVLGIMALALLLRLIAVQASPLLEDDHFRYLWDGMRTATAFDPYRLPPSAFFGHNDLPTQWQDILGGINNPDVPTIYGPLLQGLFALAWWIAPGRLEPLQFLLLLADMGVLIMLVHLGTGTRWLLAYAVHPLVLKEAMASAHPDGLVALTLLLALVAWQRRRAAWAGAMLGLAVAAKVAALLALPLLLLGPAMRQNTSPPVANGLRWPLAVAAGFAATLALLYLPFVWAGGSDAAALAAFGSQWRFNPLLYRLIEALLPAGTARPVAALLIMVGTALIAWRWRQNKRSATVPPPPPPPLDAALTLLILLSPVANPWYWLWALALSAYRGSCTVAAMAVIAAISYVNSSVLSEAAWWNGPPSAAPYLVPWPVAVLQLMVLSGAFLWDRHARTHR
jgi:alpha-1,6-mannosyltransferase